MNGPEIENRASRATSTLETAWAGLRTLIEGLPQAVLIILDISSRRRRYGHFAHSSWRYKKSRNAHEVGISPELFGSPDQVLATMLHEAAHALLLERTGSGGCGRDRYYHLKEFRDCCRNELGLRCDFLNGRYGWTLTGWPEAGVPKQYREILRKLRRDLPFGTADSVVRPRGIPKRLPASGHLKLVCSCGRIVYASPGAVSVGPIVCGLCDEVFSLHQDYRR
jgi:hypothetical protein